MAGEKVIIDVTKTGGVTVSVDGVKGESCSLVSRNIVNALGDVKSDTPTEEFYEVAANAEAQNYQ